MKKKKKFSSKDSKAKLHVGYYLVAFIDLLGQQHHLRNLDRIPILPSNTDFNELKKALKDTYGIVTGMRNSFQLFFDAFARQENDFPNFNQQQKKIYKQLDSNPISYQRFSDSIVICLSLETSIKKTPTRGIYGILGAIGCTFLMCLAAGHPIRGGIDIGLAMDITKDEIYGPALARAYTLESKKAEYPRILVGNELIKYLHLNNTKSENDIYTHVGKKLAGDCLNLISKGHDGLYFIDYLCSSFRTNISNNLGSDLIPKAYERLINDLNLYKEEKHQKLFSRYEQLKDYFESRINIPDHTTSR